MAHTFRVLRTASAAVAFAASLAVPHIALAHAALVASSPQPGEVVHGNNLHVELKFNSRVDGPRCSIMLAVDGGATRSLPLAAQSSPETISSEAQGLKKGAYSLRWQAVAADGHISRGEVPFKVE